MLRDLFNAMTYRTANTTPDNGLHVTAGRWGSRTVCDPRVPAYLEARRRRIIRDGLDALDLALMDPATADLLRATAAGMTAANSAKVAARSYPIAA
jgi:hypothetical protein